MSISKKVIDAGYTKEHFRIKVLPYGFDVIDLKEGEILHFETRQQAKEFIREELKNASK